MTVTLLPHSGTTSGTSGAGGCTPRLGALYIFALLATGDRVTACAAVRCAVAAVAEMPTALDATPSELWDALAETIQNYRGGNDNGVVATATLVTAALSNDQRAIMALIGSGLTPRAVAAILRIRVGTAKRSFAAGVRALGAALVEVESTESWNRSVQLTGRTAGSPASHVGRHLWLVSSAPADTAG
jgi:hypothetical protein